MVPPGSPDAEPALERILRSLADTSVRKGLLPVHEDQLLWYVTLLSVRGGGRAPAAGRGGADGSGHCTHCKDGADAQEAVAQQVAS